MYQLKITKKKNTIFAVQTLDDFLLVRERLRRHSGKIYCVYIEMCHVCLHDFPTQA